MTSSSVRTSSGSASYEATRRSIELGGEFGGDRMGPLLGDDIGPQLVDQSDLFSVVSSLSRPNDLTLADISSSSSFS